jgi:hypothetical protein
MNANQVPLAVHVASCTKTILVHGECDRHTWAALLWTLAYVPSEVLVVQEAGS